MKNKKIAILLLLSLLTLIINPNIDNNVVDINNNLINSNNKIENETNFTLTQKNPIITIFNPGNSVTIYQINISLTISTGAVILTYGSNVSVDYPCCRLGESKIGKYNYLIDLTEYLNLTLPTTYLQNGTEVFSVNETKGSYSIGSLTEIGVKKNNNNDYFVLIVVWILVWIRELLPFIAVGIILAVIVIIYRKY